MRLKTQLLVGALLLTAVSAAFGQGTFRNLDFEETSLVNPPAPASAVFVPFADAFPGWTGYVNTNQTVQAMFNGASGGAALMSLVTPHTAPGFGSSNQVISGNFTAVLAAGRGESVGFNVPVAIAQSGVVPLTSLSLRFSLGSLSRVSDLEVTFNGQNILFFALSAGTNYTVYGANISTFAGMVGELRFTESPISSPFSKAWLDDIVFSNQPIPEPGTVGLFAFGALLLGWRFLKRKA